jgi:hypothetical protein
MKMKVTIKMGDETHVLSEKEIEQMGGSNENGLNQLFTAKGMLTAIFSMMDIAEPEKAGKRIEVITEFEEDGQYIVMGRKPKEEIDYGR